MGDQVSSETASVKPKKPRKIGQRLSEPVVEIYLRALSVGETKVRAAALAGPTAIAFLFLRRRSPAFAERELEALKLGMDARTRGVRK